MEEEKTVALKLTNNKLEGYVAVWDSPSIRIKDGSGEYVETVKRGAFSKALASGSNIRALNAHNGSEVLASTKAGTLTLKEDAVGLFASIELPDTSVARDIKNLIAAKEEFGGSFAAKHAKYRPNGADRELVEVDVMEVTVTALPVYEATLQRSIQTLEKETEMETIKEEVVAQEATPTKTTIEVIERSINMSEPKSEFKPIVNPVIGLNEKEKQRYSLFNVVRSIANKKPIEGFEKECSDEIERQVGTAPRGNFYYPANELNYSVQRAINSTTLSALQTVNVTGFIELLKNRLGYTAAGGQTQSGLVGQVKIPKQTATSSVFYTTSEGDDVEETYPQATGSVTLNAHTVGAWVKLERSQYTQTSYDAEAFTTNDLTTAIQLGIYKACFAGTGANGQPTGLLGSSAVPNYGFSGTLSRSDILRMIALMEDQNVDTTSVSIVTTPLVKYKLQTTLKIGSTFPEYIWNDDEPNLMGHNTVITNQVKATTDEYNSVVHNMIIGDFSKCVLGLWTALDMQVDTITYATSGAVRLVALQDFDFGILRPEAFYTAQSIVTS
jgi:HK97 family phage prohead protease/HK97 family phage major capsid protein